MGLLVRLPGFDNGTHTISTTGQDVIITPVTEENRGRVCSGPGGVDTCEPAGPIPVESITWGTPG